MKKNSNYNFRYHTLILLLILLIHGFYFIPSFVKNIMNYLFIFLSFLDFFTKKGKYKLNKSNLLILLYFLASLLSCLKNINNNFFLLLSTGQFVLLNLSIMSIDKDQNELIVQKYFNILEYIIYFSVFYSLILKNFGSFSYVYETKRYVNYFIFPFISQIVIGARNDLGYSSFYTNPNLYGFYLMITIINVFFKKNDKLKIFKILVLLVGVMLANSRGVYFCLFISFVVYFIVKLKPSIRKFLFYFTIVIIVPIILLNFNNIILFMSQVNFNGRIDLWKQLLLSFKDSPILGSGFSSSKDIIIYSTKANLGSCNAYLSILAELGIVGFSIFFFIILELIKKISSLINYRDYFVNNNYFISRILIVLILLIYGIIENSLMTSENRHFIWFILFFNIMYMGSNLMVKKNEKEVS